jgi:hypothetical protein
VARRGGARPLVALPRLTLIGHFLSRDPSQSADGDRPPRRPGADELPAPALPGVVLPLLRPDRDLPGDHRRRAVPVLAPPQPPCATSTRSCSRVACRAPRAQFWGSRARPPCRGRSDSASPSRGVHARDAVELPEARPSASSSSPSPRCWS